MPRPWIEPGSSDLQSDALPSELSRLLLLQMQAGSSSSRHGEQLLKAAFADGCGVGSSTCDRCGTTVKMQGAIELGK